MERERKQAKYLAIGGWVVLLVALFGTAYFLINGVTFEHLGLVYHFPPFHGFEGIVIGFLVMLISGLILNYAYYKKSWLIVVPWIIAAALLLADALYFLFLLALVY